MTAELFISVFSLFVNLTKSQIDPEGLRGCSVAFSPLCHKEKETNNNAVDASAKSRARHAIVIQILCLSKLVCLNRFILFFMIFLTANFTVRLTAFSRHY